MEKSYSPTANMYKSVFTGTHTSSLFIAIALLTILSLLDSSAQAQTSYTWDGSADTDWNTAANWTPTGIPASTDHVTIVNATNQPVLNGNVTVANFTITGGGLDLNGDTITVSGTMLLTGGSVTDGVMNMPAGTAVTITNVTIGCELRLEANAMSINGSRFLSNVRLKKSGAGPGVDNHGANVFEQDLWVSNASTTHSLRMASSATDTVKGDLYAHSTSNLVLGQSAAFVVLGHAQLLNEQSMKLGNVSASGTFVIAGTGMQNLVPYAGVTLNVSHIVINKPWGSVKLTGNLPVTGVLALTQGILVCDTGTTVTLADNATVTGASDSSHVQGPVLKVGNDAFTFPVGHNGRFRPIAITAPSVGTDIFVGEYFNNDSDPGV